MTFTATPLFLRTGGSPKRVALCFLDDTGVAQAWAWQIRSRLRRMGVQVSLIDVEAVGAWSAVAMHSMLLWVCASRAPVDGLGRSGRELLRHLNAVSRSDVQHAVLTIGDSRLEWFGRVGLQVDEVLRQRGSTALSRVRLADGNDEHALEDFCDAAEEWLRPSTSWATRVSKMLFESPPLNRVRRPDVVFPLFAGDQVAIEFAGPSAIPRNGTLFVRAENAAVDVNPWMRTGSWRANERVVFMGETMPFVDALVWADLETIHPQSHEQAVVDGMRPLSPDTVPFERVSPHLAWVPRPSRTLVSAARDGRSVVARWSIPS